MTRYEAVRQVTREWGNARFSYGHFDCCQLARDVFKAYRGFDPAPDLKYESEEEALKIMQDHGGLEGLLTHILGGPIPVEETQTGDIVLVECKGQITGVRVPDGALVPVKRGIDKMPLRYVFKGWRI